MSKLDNMDKPALRQLVINALSDLGYAAGYCEGVGKPSGYVSDAYNELYDIVNRSDDVRVHAGGGDDQ